MRALDVNELNQVAGGCGLLGVVSTVLCDVGSLLTAVTTPACSTKSSCSTPAPTCTPPAHHC